MECQTGELLAGTLGKPWELTRLLRVAIGVSSSLGHLHRQGLLHSDVNPSHILVDRVSGNAWLAGSESESPIVSDRQAMEVPPMIGGTLPYMAPEQTGRMNRSIDSRSDLYSLGITLYEMLTGALPFTASDPIEWIHCHIARHPVPASERADGIPAVLSAIVSKLMSKNAEDRYQTAHGLEEDLRKCLEEWETHGKIDLFTLGSHDTSARLLIPEKLHGRESEVSRLHAAFDRVVTSGRPELVLVSGYSGIGKSSVVNELRKALVPARGLFASGKFDQYKRDIPYATLCQALRSLVLRFLGKSDTELANWRTLLQVAVGGHGQLIVNLIPEAELIIGRQPPIADLARNDSETRFRGVLRRFLGALAQQEHPLVLFLDDLQWTDSATLVLLEYLLVEPGVQHLLLIGAYRDNEVDPTHPLVRTLKVFREAEIAMDEIVLAPLDLGDTDRLVADTLNCTPERAGRLAGLIYEKTAGNPFFAMQFLNALAEENLILYMPEIAAWSWDLERIRAKSHTDNVVDLMIAKLNRLSVTTRDVLKQLASLGSSAETTTLGMVHGVSVEEIHSALWEAVNVGLVSRRDNSYAFLHDRIQEAAYALVPEDEQAPIHLRIGRLLTENTPVEKREENIFEIVNQLNRGVELITSPQERELVAGLNLIAGKRAKTATAYSSSLVYVSTGMVLLGEDCWQRHYALMFAMELSRAECEFLIGETAAAEERLSTLAVHAIALVDRAAVTRLRVALYTTLDRSDRAIEVGLEYLQSIGIEWSPHPTDEEIRWECERMWHLLGNRPIEELIDLSLMNDPDWRATMDVLVEIAPPARFTGGNLHHLLLLRMTNLSLEHGNCDGSCYAYACLPIVLGHRFNDYQTGFRFGKLGVDLVDRRGLDRFKARVYMCFGLLMPWTKHAPSRRDWMRRSFTTANGMGDLTFAAYSTKNLITNLLVSGVPLGEVQQEAEYGLTFSRKAQFGLVVDSFIGQLALIRSLRGLTPDFVLNDEEEGNEIRFERYLAEKPHLSFPACCYWIHKLQALFFAGDHTGAVEAALKAHDLLWATKSFLEEADYHFYAALTRAAAASDAALVDRRQEHIEALLNHYEQLVIWAESCPENFANRASLVAAEIARLEHRELDAMRLYEDAIRLAREQSFIQNEGLANEHAAWFCAGHGFQASSHAYLRNARQCYLRWGADGKVKQLDRLHPHLREEPMVLGSTSTIGSPVEHLDLATVVRVSQAVSGEIVFERLIQTLMRIVVEHAGAERALFILPQDDEQRIEAEAITGREGITVRFVGRTLISSDLPESVLKYVIRAQETVILDDALTPNLFSSDGYIAQKRARSILCISLVKQMNVVGVLYLENSTTSYAFTPDRVGVLKLLASQAAISIENARFYKVRQESEDRLRLVIDTIPAMVWSNSADGSVESVNQRWLEYTGLIGDLALGDGWLAAIHPDDIAGVVKIRDEGLATSKPYQFEARIRRTDGEYRYFLVRVFPLRDETGKIVKWYGANTDIEDHRRAEEALQTAFEKIRELKDELHRENVALKEEIKQSSMFEEIVGSSSALETVLSRASKVAPTDSTVLITGETGTGKELIARAIHKASLRSERPFVSVNCAAIPQSLIASELFGHEKGAFTGAQQRRLGRFELADGGTIFLDEVGELPAETQVALLRVLQEREFERVGGNRLIRTDVRVITATNRNLHDAIADGTFRSDLFYRLNVFPIEIPPLRGRKEDIPMLVQSFIDRFARKMGKKIRRIKKTTMDRLLSYPWPGNVRELQNVIERSLVICETDTFTVDESWLEFCPVAISKSPVPWSQTSTTKLSERATIEAVLAETEGRVSGPRGAAARLNMPASTLDYKIRNSNIDKHRFKTR